MDRLAVISSDSARFLQLLASADPGAPVPACHEWTVHDLLWHLTEVQWFWGSIVAGRLADPGPAEEGKPDRPDDHEAATVLFDVSTRRLQDALAVADDQDQVWTWYPPDQTVGFVRRRQMHEAVVHRVDAEQATGHQSVIDSEVATDGIDEILRVMIGDIPPWATFEPDGTALRIESSDMDGRRWGVAFGRMRGTSPVTGRDYDMDASSVGLDAENADGVLTGRVASLYLWLWGRASPEDLTSEGNDALPRRLRALAFDATQ